MIQQRKKQNSSKINLTISVVFHSALILVLFFFAAREGILGKKLRQITVTMVPKEKKPEPPKAKPAEPKVEPAKPTEPPKTAIAVATPKTETAAPPPADSPAIAPPPASLSGFEFHDGAHEVQTTSDGNALYKATVERALRSHWNRPENMQDEQYVAEVDLTIDPGGKLKGYQWRKGSGNPRWDETVKAALAKTTSISRPPPKGFPDKFLVRFDVESLKTEDVIQISTR